MRGETMADRRRLTTRKLLVASIGVATIQMSGCVTSGNLVAPPPVEVDAGDADAADAPDEGEVEGDLGPDAP